MLCPIRLILAQTKVVDKKYVFENEEVNNFANWYRLFLLIRRLFAPNNAQLCDNEPMAN